MAASDSRSYRVSRDTPQEPAEYGNGGSGGYSADGDSYPAASGNWGQDSQSPYPPAAPQSGQLPSEPSYSEHSYTEPSYTEPSYTEPSYTEPATDESAPYAYPYPESTPAPETAPYGDTSGYGKRSYRPAPDYSEPRDQRDRY